MSIRNLDSLFRPKSVAVVGASNRPRSIGAVTMSNLLTAGFEGPILPVNPKHRSVAGVLAYASVRELPITPDAAVICTPPQTVPTLIDDLGQRGTRGAIVLTAGLSAETGPSGRSIQDEMLEAAGRHRMRVLGPNCVGMIIPGIGLNASFSHVAALPGRIAFLSQSGALCTAALDWARARGIGFSHFVSLGNIADVDFGDVLDYLAVDPHAHAILLYIEWIRQKSARKFMSAARAAARNKPVLVVKSGRFAEGARAAASHTGALAGADAVFDTAFQRAGMLRVFDIDELFEAVETLARTRRADGDRVLILTNGGGPAVTATDALVAAGGRLATLSEQTIHALNQVLPRTWSGANPVDIIGDATAERYAGALRIVLDDRGADVFLVLYAPTAIIGAEEAASAVAAVARESRRNILTCWLGGETAVRGRKILSAAGIPTYDTPESAVRALLHIVQYQRNQLTLMETPPSAPGDFSLDLATVRGIIDPALAERRELLNENESKAVLSACGVPVVETRFARDPQEAATLAEELGFPVALKIVSPQITHKSDVHGVTLNLESAAETRAAAESMRTRLARLRPDAELAGYSVQRMINTRDAFELIIGVSTDSVFGPVILFGHGGTAVEVIGDRAIALPPLNVALADQLIARTRISKLLSGYRDRPGVDMDAVRLLLLKISQLVVDLPEIVEMDMNPVISGPEGVLVLDARIRIARASNPGAARLAIRPYPRELEETITLRGGPSVMLRPIRPEDERAHSVFISKLSPRDLYFRFFGVVLELPHSELARLTQIDYDREMAFIATPSRDGVEAETYGVVRVGFDPDNRRAEFAIVVRGDLQRQGLGRALMDKVIRYCRARGTAQIVGQVMAENEDMLALARSIGFEVGPSAETNILNVALNLSALTS